MTEYSRKSWEFCGGAFGFGRDAGFSGASPEGPLRPHFSKNGASQKAAVLARMRCFQPPMCHAGQEVFCVTPTCEPGGEASFA